jgi:hypothetical protein
MVPALTGWLAEQSIAEIGIVAFAGSYPADEHLAQALERPSTPGGSAFS